jgi:hypothetical protein
MNEIQEKVAEMESMIGFLSATSLKFTDAANLASRSLPPIVSGAPMGSSVDLVSFMSKTIDDLESSLKKIKGELAKAKEVYLPAKFDSEGVKTFNSDKYRMTRTSRVFASIIGDKDEAFKWLEEHEYGSLIKPTVNASSLSSVAKEVIEGGMELPDDLFRSHIKDSVSITAVKVKRGE